MSGTATAAAERLSGTRRGSGAPLVLLHALGTDHRMWDPVVDRLAAEREVVALDMPGFGGSPAIDPAAPRDLARAVAGHLAAEGLSGADVAGNSLGGWVALELALAGAARSVTAIAPAGLWPRPLLPRKGGARDVARALLPVLRPVLQSRRGRALALAASVAHPERVPPDAAARLVRAYATAPGFDAANAAMRAGRFTALDRIAVPVTLAWPDRDRLVRSPDTVPANVRTVVLHDCGHLPTWDDPEQVAAALLAGAARG